MKHPFQPTRLRSKKMRCFCVGFFHLKTDHPFRHAKKHLPTLRNGLNKRNRGYPADFEFIERPLKNILVEGKLNGNEKNKSCRIFDYSGCRNPSMHCDEKHCMHSATSHPS